MFETRRWNGAGHMTDASDYHGFGGKRCRCCEPGPAQPPFEVAMSDQVEQALLHGLFPATDLAP